MKRKDNYVMMKRATPKQVTLPNGRTLVASTKEYVDQDYHHI